MDLDAFRGLLTPAGQTAAGPRPGGVRRPRRRRAAHGHRAAPGRRARGRGGRPHPGRAAPPGRRQVRRGPRRAACTSRRTAWSRPPGSASPSTGPPASPWPTRAPCSTSAAASAATWSRSRGPASPSPGVDRDPLRVEVARANLAALGLGGAVQVAQAEDLDTTGLRGGLRRPGAARRGRPGVRPGGVVAAVVVRGDAAGPAVLREGRARDPARGGPAGRRDGVRQRRAAR